MCIRDRYLADPEKIKTVEKKIADYFEGKVNISVSDSMYQKIQMQLRQIERISNLILGGITLITLFVITLLYCIWIRDRKKEFGIFLSLGYTKRNIFFQIFTESELILFVSVIMGSLLSGQIINVAMGLFNEIQVSRINLDMGINFEIISQVFITEMGITLIAILMAMLSVFVKRPREILSEMED